MGTSVCHYYTPPLKPTTMSNALRFNTIDGIIASVDAHHRPTLAQANYLCAEARIIVDMLKDDMTAEESQSYAAWSQHLENSNVRGSAYYLDAADRFWRFAVRTYHDIANRRSAEAVRPLRPAEPPVAPPPQPVPAPVPLPSTQSQQRQQQFPDAAAPSTHGQTANFPLWYRPRYAAVAYVPGLVAGWAPVHPHIVPWYYHPWSH